MELMWKLIKVKVPKAVLFLTQEEFRAGLERGKAITRAEKLNKRLSKDRQSNIGNPDNH